MASEPPVEYIERQQWLEPLETGVQNAVAKAFESGGETGQKVKDALHGKWLGHALHPALTDVPIGAWTATLVLDLMEASGRRDVRAGADVTLAVGLAGAGMAALAGITDWHEMEGKPRRVGLAHGMLNIVSAGLYTASMVARSKRNRAAGRYLALAGFSISMVSAYLGGSLVFGEAAPQNGNSSDAGQPA